MRRAEGGARARSARARSTTGRVAEDVRAWLRATSLATEQLIDELEATGLPKSVRQAPTGRMLPALDRSLPWQTLDDFLAACEAYTLVTAPSAFSRGDVGALRHGAEQLRFTLEMLLSTANARHTWTTNTIPCMQASLLPAALGEPRVQHALRALLEPLTQLSAVDHGDRLSPRRRLRPLGDRFLMPGSVVATALALIVFLLGTVRTVTGTVNTSAGGIALKGTATSSTYATPPPGSAPPSSTHAPTPAPFHTTTTSNGAMPVNAQLNQDPDSQDPYPGAPQDQGDPG